MQNFANSICFQVIFVFNTRLIIANFVNFLFQSGQFSEDMIPTVGFNMRKITKGNVTIKGKFILVLFSILNSGVGVPTQQRKRYTCIGTAVLIICCHTPATI